MAEHQMIPAMVDGFAEQCAKCGMLDTQIRFGSKHCPAADLEPNQGLLPTQAELAQLPADEQLAVIDDFVPNKDQRICAIQAHWFQGYFYRQFLRAGGINPKTLSR